MPISSAFKFHTIDEATTAKIISNMQPKTSSGIDNISSRLLKNCAVYLTAPITAIINQSLVNGIFPDFIKIAKVVPIYKKEDEHIFDNYRPISILPSISKIFEKVTHVQLCEYFVINKLLYAHQYGFREGHSTEYAILEFC